MKRKVGNLDEIDRAILLFKMQATFWKMFAKTTCLESPNLWLILVASFEIKLSVSIQRPPKDSKTNGR